MECLRLCQGLFGTLPNNQILRDRKEPCIFWGQSERLMWGEGDGAAKRFSKGKAVEELSQIMKIWGALRQPLWLLDLERGRYAGVRGKQTCLSFQHIRVKRDASKRPSRLSSPGGSCL